MRFLNKLPLIMALTLVPNVAWSRSSVTLEELDTAVKRLERRLSEVEKKLDEGSDHSRTTWSCVIKAVGSFFAGSGPSKAEAINAAKAKCTENWACRASSNHELECSKD